MTATDDALDLTRTAARAAWDKSGEQIVALVGALGDAVEEALLRVGRKPLRREGNHEQRWVLLDYGDLVVHVQHSEERVLYNLERLWKDCPVVDLQLPDA